MGRTAVGSPGLQGRGRGTARKEAGARARVRTDAAAAEAAWQEARAGFLAALATGASVSAAAAKAGLARRIVTDRRAADADFARDWEDAIEAGTDHIQDRLLARAIVGWDEPVFNGGKQVGTRRVFDGMLGLAMLKARRPDEYKRAGSGKVAASGQGDGAARDARARVADKLAALAKGRKPSGSGA